MLNLDINLKGRKWLVVGGGKVATRRIKKILAANGTVKLVSPEISKTLSNIKNKNLKILKRKFKKSDIGKEDFILVCTNDKELNNRIAITAKSKKILVCDASSKENNDFSFTSNIKVNKDIKINFSSNGKSPSLTKFLRVYFEKELKKKVSKYKSKKLR